MCGVLEFQAHADSDEILKERRASPCGATDLHSYRLGAKLRMAPDPSLARAKMDQMIDARRGVDFDFLSDLELTNPQARIPQLGFC
jgi:hypothetical protein